MAKLEEALGLDSRYNKRFEADNSLFIKFQFLLQDKKETKQKRVA